MLLLELLQILLFQHEQVGSLGDLVHFVAFFDSGIDVGWVLRWLHVLWQNNRLVILLQYRFDLNVFIGLNEYQIAHLIIILTIRRLIIHNIVHMQPVCELELDVGFSVHKLSHISDKQLSIELQDILGLLVVGSEQQELGCLLDVVPDAQFGQTLFHVQVEGVELYGTNAYLFKLIA